MDADIVCERRVTRRSLLGALGLGAGAAATVIFAAERAPAADASSKKKKAKKPAKKQGRRPTRTKCWLVLATSLRLVSRAGPCT